MNRSSLNDIALICAILTPLTASKAAFAAPPTPGHALANLGELYLRVEKPLPVRRASSLGQIYFSQGDIVTDEKQLGQLITQPLQPPFCFITLPIQSQAKVVPQKEVGHFDAISQTSSLKWELFGDSELIYSFVCAGLNGAATLEDAQKIVGSKLSLSLTAPK